MILCFSGKYYFYIVHTICPSLLIFCRTTYILFYMNLFQVICLVLFPYIVKVLLSIGLCFLILLKTNCFSLKKRLVKHERFSNFCLVLFAIFLFLFFNSFCFNLFCLYFLSSNIYNVILTCFNIWYVLLCSSFCLHNFNLSLFISLPFFIHFT